MGIHFVLLISRQGKVRLTKWYSAVTAKEKSRTIREVSAVVLSRQQKQCNFLEYKDKKIIYKRCARRRRRTRTRWHTRHARQAASRSPSPLEDASARRADPSALRGCL